MEIKPGYKLTEAGAIPENWEPRRLGDIASVAAGGTPRRNVPAYWNGDIPWVTTSQINFDTITGATQFISKLGLKTSAAKLLPPGTLLLALYGQGKTRGKVGILGITAATNQACASIVIASDVSPAYVFHFLAGKYETIRSLSNSGSQENLNGLIVKSITVALPSTKAEQEAIAKYLSDADALIESLERLITKKRLLKKGAMQELFSPKNGWSTKRLGESCEIITKGTTPTSIGRNFTSTGINFLKAESIGPGGEPIPSKTAFIDEYTNKLLLRSQLTEGDILISIAGVLGRVGIVDRDVLPANVNQALAVVRLKNRAPVERRYLFYYLRSHIIQQHISDINVQAAQANISIQNVTDFQISAPPSREEQTAIATILSDMDAEIDALEAKLAKAGQIKQGMMQNLLTGKIRLV